MKEINIVKNNIKEVHNTKGTLSPKKASKKNI